MNQAQSTAMKQNLADNVNANAQISAYCSAVTNTTVAPSDGAWYAPFMANLAAAQGHASLYLSTIGPNTWSTIPGAIVGYGQNYATSMSFVQQILDAAGSDDLTTQQMSDIRQIFGALVPSLTTLLGTAKDTNLPVGGDPAPAEATVRGCLNDLNTFDSDITVDNRHLTAGKNGAAQEVSLLEADETNIKTDIKNLNEEIQIFNNDVAYAEMGIGVSLFVAVVGIALAVATGGASLVATGVGIAGLGGSIAATVVYSEKVKAAQNKVAADQKDLTTDQQQVAQLNAIILSIHGLKAKNVLAQAALQATVDTYTTLIKDTNTVLDAMNGADSDTFKSILQNIEVQDSIEYWNDLVTFAQNILTMTLQHQILTPPAPALSA